MKNRLAVFVFAVALFVSYNLSFVTVYAANYYNLGTVTLKNGSRGEAVKELQRFLNDKLNLGLILDGKLGPKTIAVIKKWQQDNGLKADGLVGAKTKALMNSQVAPVGSVNTTPASNPIEPVTTPQTTTSVATQTTNTTTTTAPAQPSSTQPFFSINRMEPTATGAIAIVGKYYSGGVGFHTTTAVMKSKLISFNMQGLPPGLVADKYVNQFSYSNQGYVSFQGTPTQAGNFPIVVTFTYGDGFKTSKTFYFNVSPEGTVVTSLPQHTSVPSAPYTPPAPEPSSTSNPTTTTPTTPVTTCVPSNSSSTPAASTNSVGTITITSPNGGECISKGSTRDITWTSSSNIDKVTIMHVSSAGSVNYVASSTPNTGSYTWNVNVGNTTNTQYKIEILGYQTGVGSVSDKSDNYFTVN